MRYFPFSLTTLLLIGFIFIPGFRADAQQRYEGLTRPYRQVVLTVQRPGEVKSLAVKEGDLVKAEAVLLSLNDQLQLQQIEVQKLAVHMAELQSSATAEKVNAEARLKEAEFRHEQLKSLNASASRLELEQARLQLIQAKAGLQAVEESQALAQKRWALEKGRLQQELEKLKLYQVKAPFEGIIYRMNVELGQSVTPNDRELILLIDQSKLKVDIHVPQSLMPVLKEGKSYRLGLKNLNQNKEVVVEGELVLIDAIVDPASLTCRVTFELGNEKGRFRAGQRASLLISAE